MLAYAAQNLCFLNADAKNNGALRKHLSDWKAFKKQFVNKPRLSGRDLMAMAVNKGEGREAANFPEGLHGCKPMTFQLQSMQWMVRAVRGRAPLPRHPIFSFSHSPWLSLSLPPLLASASLGLRGAAGA